MGQTLARACPKKPDFGDPIIFIIPANYFSLF
jgi:hypothetical protein